MHGSAFERVTATQIGFTDGAGACTKMDADEIESRRADLPQQFAEGNDSGELPVTEATLDEFVKTFQAIFDLPEPPKVDFTGADTGCSDAVATEPVSYCPSTNTIGVSVDDLAERGTPSPRRAATSSIQTNVTGDYNAYVLLASRYTLAVQKEHGQIARHSADCLARRLPVRRHHRGAQSARTLRRPELKSHSPPATSTRPCRGC